MAEQTRTPGPDQLSEPVKAAIDYAAGTLKGAASTDRTVTLKRSETQQTPDQALWVAIRNRTEAISFDHYNTFIDRVLCQDIPSWHGGTPVGRDNEREMGSPSLESRRKDLLLNRPTIYGVDAYHLLKLATEIFLILEAGVVRVAGGKVALLDPGLFEADEENGRLNRTATSISDIESQLLEYFGIRVPGAPKQPGTTLPYLRRILNALPVLQEGPPYCEAILQYRLSSPSLIELIWSYWQEEGMLVQTMKAIAWRFQNRRGPAERDPLANLEIDPLRPLNNLLWGFIQDEYNHLTVPRRAYEYDHHYGLTLVGKAVPRLESADSRSKFIEAFHNLLYRTAIFFREDADTTVIADAFPLLNALKEVHLLLAEGAHNQFGDLPWTARVEMLLMQWLLARPEIRAFLYGRAMVPYQEPWMGVVDTMKRLQGWTDTTVTHFHELAVTGERILLSVRYGDWVDINNTEDQAKNWARYWKPEIQRYIHAYQTVTGVDLTVDITDTRQAAERYFQPSAHLQRRLVAQRAQGRLPAPRTAGRVLTSEVIDYAGLPSAPRRPLLRQTTDE
jgi:hypothetical protein